MAKAVKISRDDLVLSVGDNVCVFKPKDRTWFRAAWNLMGLTDAEWISERQFLVADLEGTITLDTVEDTQFMPVKHNRLLYNIKKLIVERLTPLSAVMKG
jgi:hypothetical protein